jgi:hypothetical protein
VSVKLASMLPMTSGLVTSPFRTASTPGLDATLKIVGAVVTATQPSTPQPNFGSPLTTYLLTDCTVLPRRSPLDCSVKDYFITLQSRTQPKTT